MLLCMVLGFPMLSYPALTVTFVFDSLAYIYLLDWPQTHGPLALASRSRVLGLKVYFLLFFTE